MVSFSAEHMIFYLFVRTQLSWDMVKYSLFASYSIILHSFGKILFYVKEIKKRIWVKSNHVISMQNFPTRNHTINITIHCRHFNTIKYLITEFNARYAICKCDTINNILLIIVIIQHIYKIQSQNTN